MSAMHGLALRSLIRRRGISLLLALVVFSGIALSSALAWFTARQESALDEVVRDTLVHCVVTDAKGMSQDRLNMYSAEVEKLTGRREDVGCMLGRYVKNVRAKAGLNLTYPVDCRGVRILSLDSDPALSALEGVTVEFLDGWDESALGTSERLCLAPEGFVEPDEAGELWVECADALGGEFSLRVIGWVRGGPANTLYVPFFMLRGEESEVFPTDSCSFDIADNSLLEESRAEIFRYFVEPAPENVNDGISYGVMIQDEAYIRSRDELMSGIRLLRLLTPLLLAVMAAIGFLSGYLSARRRIKEFAVMRCLGMKRGQIFGWTFEEYAIPTAAGWLLGLGFVIPASLSVGAWPVVQALLLLLVFLLGTAIAILRITGVNVMRLMKVEE